jgi:hypothetical protein
MSSSSAQADVRARAVVACAVMTARHQRLVELTILRLPVRAGLSGDEPEPSAMGTLIQFTFTASTTTSTLYPVSWVARRREVSSFSAHLTKWMTPTHGAALAPTVGSPDRGRRAPAPRWASSSPAPWAPARMQTGVWSGPSSIQTRYLMGVSCGVSEVADEEGGPASTGNPGTTGAVRRVIVIEERCTLLECRRASPSFTRSVTARSIFMESELCNLYHKQRFRGTLGETLVALAEHPSISCGAPSTRRIPRSSNDVSERGRLPQLCDRCGRRSLAMISPNGPVRFGRRSVALRSTGSRGKSSSAVR